MQAVQHQALALVDREIGDSLPETRFGEDCAQGGLCAIDGAAQTAGEPFHPERDVYCPLLRFFKNVIVRPPLLPDLCRHAVEALRTVF